MPKDELATLIENARDWQLYHDRHGSNWQSAEWAEEIARQLAELEQP